MSSVSMILEQTWEITFGLEENTGETLSCYLFIAQQQDNRIWGKNVQRKIASACMDFTQINSLNNACFSCAQY